MGNFHNPASLPDEVVTAINDFLEQTHHDWAKDGWSNVPAESVMTIIRQVVADELWAGYRIDISPVDAEFVMRCDNSDYELVHDEQDSGVFQNASYRVPLITIAPGEREKEWAWPEEEAHRFGVDLLLRCVSVLRFGSADAAWWNRYATPALRPEMGKYLAFMFVVGQGEKKRKYLFPPLKALHMHTTPAGENCWLPVNVPQQKDFEKLREEAENCEANYYGNIIETAKAIAEVNARREDMICRVEAWLDGLELEDKPLEIEYKPEGGRRRGHRGGRGRGRGNGRTLYEPEEKPRNQGRRGGQRASRTAAGANARQPAARQLAEKSANTEIPVVRQILKRPVNP
ncbi:hypothetical protein PG987_015282 [Apiospora arundinis]